MFGVIGVTNTRAVSEDARALQSAAANLRVERARLLDGLQDEHTWLSVVAGCDSIPASVAENETGSVAVAFFGTLNSVQQTVGALEREGHRLHEPSLAEVVAHLYEEKGIGFASELDGLFACAVADRRSKAVHLISDRHATRYIFLAEKENALVWAPTATLCTAVPGVDATLDFTAFLQLMTFVHLLEDRTHFQSVKLLRPATVLTFENGTVREQEYDSFEFSEESPSASVEDYAAATAEKLVAAVRRDFERTEKVGIYISGGFDSRAILAAATHVDGKLVSFTQGHPRSRDVRFGRQLAEVAGVPWRHFQVAPDHIVQYARDVVRLDDGMLSCLHAHNCGNWERVAEEADGVFDGYAGGCLLKANFYPPPHDGSDDPIAAEKRRLYAKETVGATTGELTKLLRPEVFDDATSALRRSSDLAFEHAKGANLAARSEYFAMRNRVWRYHQPQIRRSSGHFDTLLPFCDREFLDMIQQVPGSIRKGRRLLMAVMDRLSPEMLRVRWQGSGLPLTSPRWLHRGSQILSGLSWRVHHLLGRRSRFRDMGFYVDYSHMIREHETFFAAHLAQLEDALADYLQPGSARQVLRDHSTAADHAELLCALLTYSLWLQSLGSGVVFADAAK